MAGGVPELEADGAVFEVHCLVEGTALSVGEPREEQRAIRTFERKSIPMVAWYMLSKESYMKRVIREVLPTFTVWNQRSADEILSNCHGGHTALFTQKHQPEQSIGQYLSKIQCGGCLT